MRQSSIYSLTLDEIHNTVCEPWKNFGYMNMDEFLTNIWNVEEGFEASGPTVQAHYSATVPATLNEQGSLSLPSQLCLKTVDEVWAEIHSEQQRQRRNKQLQRNLDCPKQNIGAATRKPTLGQMTLEDFLIKAGVIREGYGLTEYKVGSDGAPDFSLVYSSGAVENGRRGDLYCYSGDAGPRLQLRMTGSPVSPIPSDGMGGEDTDSYGIGMNGSAGKSACGGRKRMMEVVVEKVVEQRQRRMIKNRESAARSRARKQAYTVELETELKHLKEENARIRKEETKVRQMMKQMLFETMEKQTHHNMEKTSRSLRRCNSSPLERSSSV